MTVMTHNLEGENEMASIQRKSERKYKITVCNGYTGKGKKRCQSQTVTVPKEVAPRLILQYVYTEAQRMETRFQNGIEETDRTTFEKYALSWLQRQTDYKPATLAGYTRQLEIVYPIIGGIPLCKLRPIVLEELSAELRQRKTRRGKFISEETVQKYLNTVSAVLEDAKRNDIILYNPMRRVKKPTLQKREQRIPNPQEMKTLMECLQKEPLVYRVFYFMAIATGLRRGELCALRWNSFHTNWMLEITASRSSVPGQGILEGKTKNGKKRYVALPSSVVDLLEELQFMQLERMGGMMPDGYVFQNEVGAPIHPDSFSRRLKRLYASNGFSEDYHLHTLRHFFASFLLQNNVSKQVAVELLGHGDTSFLERTYCHPQEEYKLQAAERMDRLFESGC